MQVTFLFFLILNLSINTLKGKVRNTSHLLIIQDLIILKSIDNTGTNRRMHILLEMKKDRSNESIWTNLDPGENF